VVPYIKLPRLDLDWVVIDAFGVLVAIALVVGFFSSKRRARKVGLDPEEAHTMALWIILGSFAMAHIVAMVFYYPDRLMEKPWEILYIASPISSMGGFLGSVITALIYCRKRKISFVAYADVFIYGLVAAWVFGRLGCTTAHDHPGIRSDFFLAVQFPGGSRHDLGFYEFLFTVLVLYPVTRFLGRKPRPDGFFLALVPLIYAPVRFLFDFLRSVKFGNADPRYLGLTAAQWLCLIMLAAALPILIRIIKHGKTRPWPEAAPQQKDSQDQGVSANPDP
jgi:phosphatidylglycerol:prolipoprotein diacylglycerol transferase